MLRSAIHHNLSNNALRYGPFANVLALEDFERFVYVLSVLERYPRPEMRRSFRYFDTGNLGDTDSCYSTYGGIR